MVLRTEPVEETGATPAAGLGGALGTVHINDAAPSFPVHQAEVLAEVQGADEPEGTYANAALDAGRAQDFAAPHTTTHGPRPTVAAITVTTNERRWLPECLGSLLASRTSNVDLRVLLIDNASVDGSADFVHERFPEAHVMRNLRNEGFAGANNIGMRRALDAGADYVFLVNPDTRTPPELVQGLVDFMETWPEYGLVGPLQYEFTEDGKPTERLNAWSQDALEVGEAHVFTHTWQDHPTGAGPQEGRAPDTLEHSYVQGSALFCRADVLEQVGLFDATYHTYYEETDLCRRVRWAGWRVALVLNLGIQHYGGGGTRASVYRRRRMLRNKYYFLLTDPEWRWREIALLAGRWLRLDLQRKGAAPADTFRDALGDTLVGLGWLLRQALRIARRRHDHSRLHRYSAGGPMRTLPGQPRAEDSVTTEKSGGRTWLTTW